MASAATSFMARRSNSSASLAQFYKEHNDAFPSSVANGGPAHEGDLDFCNAFWGEEDAGYEVVMARLRASGRTMEELKGFWKERAAIEDDYAKRLSKLSKQTLGKDEIGDVKTALDTLRVETDKQAAARAKLAAEMKRDVEGPAGDFNNRMANLKKTYQASIEKSHKNKAQQEAAVAKAKERYEQDCLRINGFTANTSIVQGKELEKLQRQLDKVTATVGGNEREYQSLVRMLEESTRKWEGEWKGFCDHVQDIEEERLDFIKDNVWVYANAVSSVCVTDDESCEAVRVALEGFEAIPEVEAFVRSFGTGARIPDPPLFIDYSKGQAYHRTDQPARKAQFTRTSNRSGISAPPSQTYLNQPPEKDDSDEPSQPRAPSRGMSHNSHQSPAEIHSPQDSRPNGSMSSATSERERRPFGGVALPGMASQLQDPPRTASPAQMNATSPTSAYPQSGNNASDKLASMPRPPSSFSRPTSAFGMQAPPATGPAAMRPSASMTEDDDPIARSLAELRRDPPPVGSIRRGTSQSKNGSLSSYSGSRQSYQGPPPIKSPTTQQSGSSQVGSRMSYQGHQPGRPSMDTGLIPPTAGHTAAELARSRAEHDARTNNRAYSPGPNKDFYSAADDIVGAHPASRPATPLASHGGQQRAPSPAMMQAPAMAPSPIDEVLGQYHQAFPGERGERSRSRAGSIISNHGRQQSIGGQGQVSHQSGRAPSPAPREGFVGIGAGGGAPRSPSPQPPSQYQAMPNNMRSASPQPMMRSPSPQPPQNNMRAPSPQPPHNNMRAPSPQPGYQHGRGQSYSSSGPHGQPGYTSPVSAHPSQQPLGSLNSASTQMQQGQGGRGPQSQQGQQSQMNGYGQHNQNQNQGLSQYGSVSSLHQSQPAGQQQQPYQRQDQGYIPHSASSSGHGQGYQQPYQGGAQQPPQQNQYQYQQPQQQPPPQQHGNQYGQDPRQPQGYQNQQRAPSPQPHAQPGYGQQQRNSYQPPSQFNRAPSPSPINRSPSPVPPAPPADTPPTGQYSTTGEPVLFFKALYDYQATSDAEFNFQVGDIIAVTQTPPDGWWSGELLDEARRRPGQTEFPSNFVCLF